MNGSGVLLLIWISREATTSWQRSAPIAITIDQIQCKRELIRIPIYYTIDPSCQILCGSKSHGLLKDLELQWLAYRVVLLLPSWVLLVKSTGCHKYWNGVSRTNCSFTGSFMILVRPFDKGGMSPRANNRSLKFDFGWLCMEFIIFYAPWGPVLVRSTSYAALISEKYEVLLCTRMFFAPNLLDDRDHTSLVRLSPVCGLRWVCSTVSTPLTVLADDYHWQFDCPVGYNLLGRMLSTSHCGISFHYYQWGQWRWSLNLILTIVQKSTE